MTENLAKQKVEKNLMREETEKSLKVISETTEARLRTLQLQERVFEEKMSLLKSKEEKRADWEKLVVQTNQDLDKERERLEAERRR